MKAGKKYAGGNLDIITALKIATGMEFSMSFLVPVKKEAYILDAAFLYTSGNFSIMRTRPFGAVLLEPRTGVVVSYRNAYLDDFADPGKYPMSCKVDYSVPYAETAKEQGALVAGVQKAYPAVRELPWKESLAETDRKTALDYRTCFFRAAPKGLLPFYEALSPGFFQWLAEV